MTDPAGPTLPRPRQVTTAAWIIMGGSLLVLVTVFERMAGVNDLETREAIAKFLAEPPYDGLGWDVPAVQTMIRVASMIAGACAAAATILGFHVLRRNRGARIGLTVLAVPLFLSGLVAGGFLSSLVAVAAVMLWLEPSRDWFAGRAPRTRPEAERRERTPERPEQLPPSTPASSGPRAVQGFGTPDVHETTPLPAYGPATGPATGPAYDPTAWAATPPPAKRPPAVVAAAVVTWVFAGLAGLLMAVAALFMLTSPDLMFDEMRRQDPSLFSGSVTEDNVRTGILVLAAVLVVWSAAVTAAGVVLILRRREWARVMLLVSAAVAGLFSGLGVLQGQVVLLLPMLGAAAVFTLLLRADVRAWMAAR